MAVTRWEESKKKTRVDKGEEHLRCLCGSLLARLVPEGVELKCRRCKRHVIVPLEASVQQRIGI